MNRMRPNLVVLLSVLNELNGCASCEWVYTYSAWHWQRALLKTEDMGHALVKVYKGRLIVEYLVDSEYLASKDGGNIAF